MRILLSGASGFVGRALAPFLLSQGHEVVALVRQPDQEGVYWNPELEMAVPEDFEGFDAVIHLAGENIASKRWTPEQKTKIEASRCHDTAFLAELLGGLNYTPDVLICASAIGCYGDRGEALLTEKSGPGKGFLPQVVEKWEAASQSVTKKGIRLIHARFGVVLAPHGGVLEKMLPLFRLGLGGKLGSGEQFMSWIALEDLVHIFEFLLRREDLSGVFNCVAPQPVTQAEFARTLGHVLHRPTFLRTPAFLLRAVLGERADALLLSSARVIPERLLMNRFRFSYPDLENYLEHLFKGT